MIYFLDASVLVKRYLHEAGSEPVRALVRRRRGSIAVSALSLAEVAAGVWRRSRQGLLDPDVATAIVSRLRAELDDMVVVEPRGRTIELAAELVARHALRAYDALQLASALRLARDADQAVTFGAADKALRAAARAEGLRLMAER